MSSVKKEFKFDGTKLVAEVGFDSNDDGQPVAKLSLEIDIAEIPDEVLSAVMKKKAEAKA